MWALVAFADEAASLRWSDPVRAALRLLADSGLGGRRTLGWGRSEMPEFQEGVLPDLILPPQTAVPQGANEEPQPNPETVYWLLSVFSPAPQDSVDWKRGTYSLLTRGGRVESPAAFGVPKKLSRMIAEGSVIFAEAPVTGAAHDVSPDGFPHPVYRAGFAVAIPIPWRVTS
jgi:CRISPR type III-A-associated RAMP protein Csm4